MSFCDREKVVEKAFEYFIGYVYITTAKRTVVIVVFCKHKCYLQPSQMYLPSIQFTDDFIAGKLFGLLFNLMFSFPQKYEYLTML